MKYSLCIILQNNTLHLKTKFFICILNFQLAIFVHKRKKEKSTMKVNRNQFHKFQEPSKCKKIQNPFLKKLLILLHITRWCWLIIFLETSLYFVSVAQALWFTLLFRWFTLWCSPSLFFWNLRFFIQVLIFTDVRAIKHQSAFYCTVTGRCSGKRSLGFSKGSCPLS